MRMEVEKARKQIDKIDGELLGLLNKRIALAVEIGRGKRKAKEPVYDPAREEEIIGRLKGMNRGPLGSEDLEFIYREIFGISRKCQEPISIAYLGPETTFTHSAAIKHFGESAEMKGFETIKEVFIAVEKGEADYGVVPVENSLGGSVIYTYDMFITSPLNIVAEVSEKVSHNLVSRYRLGDIERIYTHPMALAQCRDWISKNLPKAEVVEVSSTAKGAEAAKLYVNSAGIGSELAAAHFGVPLIARNIQDKANNTTRFLVIGKGTPKKSAKCKTSIMFTTRNRVGALFYALEPFKKNGINLTMIESRPDRTRKWDYVFFLDVQGFAGDKKIKKALSEMKKNTGFLRVLGSYPEKA